MASISSSALRRALLYVPTSSQKMLTKSLTLTSDNITYDLEDSVTPHQKLAARDALRSHLSSLSKRPPSVGEVAVRINAVSTPHALADLTAVGELSSLDAVVVPKVNSPSDLEFAADVLRHVEPRDRRAPVKLLALIESARAVMDLRSICAAAPDRLDGLIFAAEDFALDLSLTRTAGLSEFLYARSAVATAARAASLASTIDLVCTSFRGEEGAKRLEEECANGKALGFNGKQCIHPNQVPSVQRMFAPSDSEVEWAVRVMIANEKAGGGGRGAWTLDGQMIDAPVVGKASTIVQKAERSGIDVGTLKHKWKDQEPE